MTKNKKMIINLHKEYISNDYNCQKDLVVKLDNNYYLVGKNGSHKFYLGLDNNDKFCKMSYGLEEKEYSFEKLSDEFVDNYGFGYIGSR